MDVLAELASNAMLKQILISSDYKNMLYQKYINNYNNIDWEKELLNEEREDANDNNN